MTKKTSAILTLLFLLPSFALAAIDADVSRDNFRASVCNISTMQVGLSLDEAFGEPIVTSKMRWEAGANTNNDCLSKLTHVWLKTRLEDDAIRYIKVSPEILQATEGFGATATESPSWSKLFCLSPEDSASCESADRARQLIASNLTFESFEVVTEARAIANLDTNGNRESSRDTEADNAVNFALEDLLTDAIDSAIDPGANAEPEPEPTPQPIQETPEERTERIASQHSEHAKSAMTNVVSLIASSLAQYTTPAHECETERVVGNWVQARGTCQLNFRSESNHEYLCSENGRSRPVRSTLKANVDLASDVSHISDIRVSQEGWAAVVLEFKDQLKEVAEGDYKTNRWQFTASTDQLDDLQQLAQSLATLKDYCETNPG